MNRKPYKHRGPSGHFEIRDLYFVPKKRGNVKDLFNASFSLSAETFTSTELTPELLREVADYFRYIFNNEWPDYAVCIPCDQLNPEGMRISAPTAYPEVELDENGYVSLEMMDKNPRTPPCPCCQKPMKILNDPEKIRGNIGAKLSNGGHVSLLRDIDNQKLVGFTFGYFGLEKGFDYEWHNPYLYMSDEQPAYERRFEDFRANLQARMGDLPDASYFVLNSIALDKKLRGGQGLYFIALLLQLLKSIPNQSRDVKIISEVMGGSTALNLFRQGGGIEIDGCLGQGHTILVTDLMECLDKANARIRNKIAAALGQKNSR